MPSQTAVKRRQSTGLGRSGPRSKNGCQACKLRRVRCDENRPVCGHCNRLKLECAFQPPQRRSRRKGTLSSSSGGGDQILDCITAEGEVDSGDTSPTNESTRGSSIRDSSTGLIDTDQGSSELCIPQPDIAMRAPPGPPSSTLPSIISEAREPDGIDQGDNTYALTPSSTLALTQIAQPSTQHEAAAAMLDTSSWGGYQHGMAFGDYLPTPDPAFSFTSMAFTSSTDLFPLNYDAGVPSLPLSQPDAPQGQWCMGTAASNHHGIMEAGQGTESSAAVTSSMDSSSRGRSGPTTSMSPPFAYCPPLLSSGQREALMSQFARDIQPPAALVGVDPLGWPQIRRYVLRTAKSSNEYVALALCALTSLQSEPAGTLRSRYNRQSDRVLASRLHEASRTAMELEILQEGWECKRSNALLVAVFLLAWFEIAYDDDDQTRPNFPSDLAEQIIVKGSSWSSGSKHLLQWLNLLDSKMSHLGGHHLLSESALKVVVLPRPEISHADAATEENSDDSGEAAHASVEADAGASRALQRTKKKRGSRLAYLLASEPPATLPPKIVKMDIFNILLQPAFEFHLISQAFSRRIGCHDRHHRSRETPEDEYEVMTACMGFENELQELWRRRPGILNLGADQLRHFVSGSIARRLEQLFSVYIATFWIHFVYIHRVAFWAMKHTPIARKALEETGKMMRRSVGQAPDQLAFDTARPRTSATVIHPGLLWTCFLFGCEVSDPVQQQWAVQQLRALGELDLTSLEAGEGSNDELPAFRLDEKGAQNALKVSSLLRVLVEQQTKTGSRVDGKFLCQEIFGCHFYII